MYVCEWGVHPSSLGWHYLGVHQLQADQVRQPAWQTENTSQSLSAVCSATSSAAFSDVTNDTSPEEASWEST